MPGTYSQIYIQLVFAVKGRESLIHSEWEERLFQYITGVVRARDQKMLAINGTTDHIHFLIGMNPNCRLSDLVREVKKASNDFIEKNKFTTFKFRWQEGYGAFSYSRSQLDYVVKYIMNQKEHHRKITFREEYIDLLKMFAIEHDVRYLFDWIE